MNLETLAAQRVWDSQVGVGTPREVGVNLKQGYNGDLTSRQAGSVGGQMVKNVCPVRKTSFPRENRTAQGHEFLAGYQAALCL